MTVAETLLLQQGLELCLLCGDLHIQLCSGALTQPEENDYTCSMLRACVRLGLVNSVPLA